MAMEPAKAGKHRQAAQQIALFLNLMSALPIRSAATRKFAARDRAFQLTAPIAPSAAHARGALKIPAAHAAMGPLDATAKTNRATYLFSLSEKNMVPLKFI